MTASELSLLVWWVQQGASERVSTSALSGPLAAAWGPKVQTSGAAGSGDASPRAGGGSADSQSDSLLAEDAGATSGDAGVSAAGGGAGAKAGDAAGSSTDEPSAPEVAGATTAGADAAGAATAGAAAAGAARDDSVLLYPEIIAPLLARRCGACHTGASAIGIDVTDLPAMLETGDVVPGEPESSPLLTRQLLPLEELGHMPPKGEPQPEAWELEVTRLWIRDGATAELRVARADLPPEALTASDEPAPTSGVKATPGGGCAACAVGHGSDATTALGGFSAALALGALWSWRLRRRSWHAVRER